MRIEESLKSEVGNCIDFANDILKNKKRNVGEARVNYNLIKYKKIREYKILEEIGHRDKIEFEREVDGYIDDMED